MVTKMVKLNTKMIRKTRVRIMTKIIGMLKTTRIRRIIRKIRRNSMIIIIIRMRITRILRMMR